MSGKAFDVLAQLRPQLPKGVPESKPVVVSKKDEEQLTDEELFLKYSKK